MGIRRLLTEPLLHFGVAGLALFVAYGWLASGDSSGSQIVITQGVVDDLTTQHVAARGREPSAAELGHLIESYVRDEILYREGVTLGLDRDDIVVKRRVRQKLEVMAEEEASGAQPTDAELSAYLAAHEQRFARPAILSFEQIFLGSSGPEAVQRVVAVTRDAIGRGIDPTTLGQPTLLPPKMTRMESDLVARSFGEAFAASVEKAPVGEWAGPIDSGYGAHYVRVSERTPAMTPRLADVRDQVVREWENERRRRARDESYTKMRAGYSVSIDATLPAQP